MRKFCQTDLATDPGTKWQYSNTGYVMHPHLMTCSVARDALPAIRVPEPYAGEVTVSRTRKARAASRRKRRMGLVAHDLSDAQWAVLHPEARAAMADLVRCSGRPMVHDLRAMVDAVGYVTRYGIEWRALPADFPPHPAVYAFFERWSARGLPQRLVDVLRGRIRIAHGRAALPTAGSIDSQSVKAADTVGNASRGYDGGKKINGRKRHIAVDTLGLLLVVFVTPASVQDRDGAYPLLALLRQQFSVR